MAESLFASGGIEGTSLRQIAIAAGAANTNVVAYHFGGKDELVEAIFKKRLPEIDARRAALLEEAEAAGRGEEILPLLDALWRPFFEQENASGQHSYAAFLMSVFRSNRFDLRISLDGDFPATQKIVSRIATRSGTDTETGGHRLVIQLAMVAAALAQIDQKELDPEQAAALFADVLRMTEKAMQAPLEHSEKRP